MLVPETINAGALEQQNGLEVDLISRFALFVDAAPRTVDTYTKNIRQFFKYLSYEGIRNPHREDIIAYRDHLREEYKPSTVQGYMFALKLFFRWTEAENLYPNIADHVKGATIDKNFKKDCLTSKQVQRVLSSINRDSVEGLRNYAIMALMFTTALRTIEVSRANVEDIRTVGDSIVLYVQGKGREERTEYVKIMPEVEAAIRDYLAARGKAEALFTSNSNNSKGKRLSTRSISGIVKAALKAAGYDSETLTAHSTRHTAVTLALLGGQSLQEAQQFARHKDISTTTIYAHNLDRAANQCENTIAKAIF